MPRAAASASNSRTQPRAACVAPVLLQAAPDGETGRGGVSLGVGLGVRATGMRGKPIDRIRGGGADRNSRIVLASRVSLLCFVP